MKKVFVCSPLSAPTPEEVQGNIARARRYCRKLARQGIIPYAPHTYFTEFLDDTVPLERETGMMMGSQWLLESDEVHVLGTRVSSGMSAEIIKAMNNGIPVIDISKEEEE